MPGRLYHSPAEVTRRLLILLGLGNDPPSNNWPIYTFNEPDKPDNVMTVFDTPGRIEGFLQTSGEAQERYGIQVRLRATRDDVGWLKLNEVAVALDEQAYADAVAIGTHAYCVADYARASVVSLGKEEPTTKRSLFTLNALVSLRAAS